MVKILGREDLDRAVWESHSEEEIYKPTPEEWEEASLLTGGEELSRLQEWQVQRPWVLTLLDPRNWNKTGGAEFLAKSKVGDAGKDKITQDLADHWEDQFWKNPKQQPFCAHSVGLEETVMPSFV